MLASVAWINDYLDRPASADEQAELLTQAGLPLEGRADIEGDVQLNVETTSNRGDCLAHVALAREIAAISGRQLRAPGSPSRATGPAASSIVRVTNREPALCPLYVARVIRGVKVGPSPDWLARRLRAIDQIPRNNLVDASNFVLFELGQPTHLFDLAKLAGPEIIIRRASEGESFLPIGEGAAGVKLSSADLVIADARTAVAIAGVKGGAPTAVSSNTRDIVLEIATFDPVSVRTTSRRLGIASDSSYRFERGVHPGQLARAADRLVELILDLAGGELCAGELVDGRPIPPSRQVSMRPERCRRILGIAISDEQMMSALRGLGFEPRCSGDRIECTVPVERLDIEREIDLIEEVARVRGLDAIHVADTIAVRVAPPQATELARQAVTSALVGMGYLQTTKHTLVSEAMAKPFLAPGRELLRVDEGRAKAEPILRPSLLPSLLQVRAFNRDRGVNDLKLFESAAVFWGENGAAREQLQLGLLADAEDPSTALRAVRGSIERLIELLLGPEATVTVHPDDQAAWFAPGAMVMVNGDAIGRMGSLSPQATRRFDLDLPLVAAELDLARFYDRYPPEREAQPLPLFPPIERDISAVLDERTTWASVESTVRGLDLAHLEAVEFVTTYRARQIGAGRKSLTLRLRFRASDRTLTHDEVDTPVNAVMRALETNLGAEIRR